MPRKVILLNYSRCELNGFCDALEKSYSVAIYVKTYNNSNLDMKL